MLKESRTRIILDQLISNPNYAAQEKLDGMRAIIHICKDGLRIFSRSAGVDDPTRPLEKTSSLPHLAVDEVSELAGTILDAEILAPGIDVASMSGAIHSKQAGTTNGLVKAFVFDVLRFIGDDLSVQNSPATNRSFGNPQDADPIAIHRISALGIHIRGQTETL